MPGLLTCPDTENNLVPPLFGLPSAAKTSAPLLIINGTDAKVSVLLIVVGLPYKPYIIAYSSSSILNIGRDDYKKYIYAYVDTSTPDQNPTNVPTILKTFVKSHTPFDDLHYCLICIINENSESIDFSQTNFLVNSAVTTTNNTELLNPQNKINAITPQALSLFSNLGHVDAFDIRVLQNGGYAKDRVIREYDTTGYWVYYQSLIDSNINPKPTLASHVGWMTIAIYETRGGLLSPTYKQIGAGGYSLNEGNRITYHNNDGSSNPCEYGLNGAITNKYTDSTKGFIIGSVQSIGNQGFKMRYNGQKSVTIYGTMVLDASQYPHAIGLLGVELASGITMVSLQAVENLIPSPNNPYNFSSRLIINPGQTASVDVYFNQNVFGWLVNIMVEAQLA